MCCLYATDPARPCPANCRRQNFLKCPAITRLHREMQVFPSRLWEFGGPWRPDCVSKHHCHFLMPHLLSLGHVHRCWRRWGYARADIRSTPKRRRKAAFLCLSLSRLRAPEQAKKQTDDPQTRANTRLRALNAQEGRGLDLAGISGICTALACKSLIYQRKRPLTVCR